MYIQVPCVRWEHEHSALERYLTQVLQVDFVGGVLVIVVKLYIYIFVRCSSKMIVLTGCLHHKRFYFFR